MSAGVVSAAMLRNQSLTLALLAIVVCSLSSTTKTGDWNVGWE